MSALAIEVPVNVVAKARRHLAKTGRPLLLRDRRRRNDWSLVALPANRGYLLLLGPETPPAQWYFAMAEEYPHRDPMADLAKGAVTVLAEVPQRFVSDGKVIGVWEVVEGSVCVRGPIALSCVSWTLRERRVGFYLTLSEIGPE
jgi:hypothetical protein